MQSVAARAKYFGDLQSDDFWADWNLHLVSGRLQCALLWIPRKACSDQQRAPEQYLCLLLGIHGFRHVLFRWRHRASLHPLRYLVQRPLWNDRKTDYHGLFFLC